MRRKEDAPLSSYRTKTKKPPHPTTRAKNTPLNHSLETCVKTPHLENSPPYQHNKKRHPAFAEWRCYDYFSPKSISHGTRRNSEVHQITRRSAKRHFRNVSSRHRQQHPHRNFTFEQTAAVDIANDPKICDNRKSRARISSHRQPLRVSTEMTIRSVCPRSL